MAERIHDDEIDLAVSTLTGDIRDFLLTRIQHQQKPYQQMSEEEQLGIIAACEGAADKLVREAVKAIAASGRKTITGQLEQVTVKDDFKAVIRLSKSDECRHELIDSCGQAVLIVVADADEFDGQREAPKVYPDQPDMVDGTYYRENDPEEEDEDGGDDGDTKLLPHRKDIDG